MVFVWKLNVLACSPPNPVMWLNVSPCLWSNFGCFC